MAILLDKTTKVIVQGITGKQGEFHTRAMLEYGTAIVAGVTPGKGGEEVEGIPVYDSMKEAVKATSAETSVIFVPAPFVYSAAMEALDAGIKLLVIITEGVPVKDAALIRKKAIDQGVVLVGPNCPGLITPGEAKIGIIPGKICKPGKVGIISRSGTLTYELIQNLTMADMGQSTVVGLGGDPVHGIDFKDGLLMFENDPDTEHIVIVGEIGGTGEQDAAEFVKEQISKPVYAFIAGNGTWVKPGKKMGHAGAIVEGKSGTAREKMKVLNECGVVTVETPQEIPQKIKERM